MDHHPSKKLGPWVVALCLIIAGMGALVFLRHKSPDRGRVVAATCERAGQGAPELPVDPEPSTISAGAQRRAVLAEPSAEGVADGPAKFHVKVVTALREPVENARVQ